MVLGRARVEIKLEGIGIWLIVLIVRAVVLTGACVTVTAGCSHATSFVGVVIDLTVFADEYISADFDVRFYFL